jgi:hypothetical protein
MQDPNPYASPQAAPEVEESGLAESVRAERQIIGVGQTAMLTGFVIYLLCAMLLSITWVPEARVWIELGFGAGYLVMFVAAATIALRLHGWVVGGLLTLTVLVPCVNFLTVFYLQHAAGVFLAQSLEPHHLFESPPSGEAPRNNMADRA